MRPYVTLQSRHVGQPTLQAFGRSWLVSGFLGRVLPVDVGKRVYLVPCEDPQAPAILQVENNAQRDARLAAASHRR